MAGLLEQRQLVFAKLLPRRKKWQRYYNAPAVGFKIEAFFAQYSFVFPRKFAKEEGGVLHGSGKVAVGRKLAMFPRF
jgi:hypothetical protein